MFFSIQILEFSGHGMRIKKAKRLIQDAISSENKKISLFEPGLYEFNNTFLEIRENTFAFDLLEIIEESKVSIDAILSVYDNALETDKPIISIGSNFDLNNYLAVSYLIPKNKKNYILSILQNFEDKEISFTLSKIMKIEPSNTKKVSGIFDEMLKGFREVTKEYANRNKKV